MMFHVGLAYVDIGLSPHWRRKPGKLGPDRVGWGVLRAFWAGPFGVLILSNWGGHDGSRRN